MRTIARVGRAVRQVVGTRGGRSGLLGVGLGAAAAAAVGALVRRRRSQRAEAVQLPDPGTLAAETAVSVHNAAKSTVIRAVRTADLPDEQLVVDTVRQAVLEGAQAGVDVAAVAIGAVEGAAEAAPLFDSDPAEVASVAARSVSEAAADQGEVAASRTREVLAAHL